MKRMLTAFACMLLLLGVAGCAVIATKPDEAPIDAVHNSRNSLDWAGVYAGIIPAASGPGINVAITLREDLTYLLQYQYIGRQGGGFTLAGTFKWNEDGNSITLDAQNLPPHYRVGENRLIQLDMDGELITGELADSYVLIKQL